MFIEAYLTYYTHFNESNMLFVLIYKTADGKSRQLKFFLN